MKSFFKKTITGLFLILICGNNALASDPLKDMGVIKPKVRLEAPDFTLESLKDGKSGLIDFKGKVIILNFWATWCVPCRKEMPSMEKLWNKFKEKDFVIIAVSADRGNRKGVESFVDKLGLTFPILLDPKGNVRNDYEVMALPMTYIIGRDGKISGRLIGEREWDGTKADALVEHFLNQGT